MSNPKFTVSPAAQREYRVLGGTKPSGANAAARGALEKAHAARKPEAVHVTRRDSGWAVKTEGRERAASVQPTKAQALEAARDKAAAQGARLVEHGRDGRIIKNTKTLSKPR
ncbi:MAG TPA: DUF2188 domain-containing protein [Candidatus Limnocylindrales bacterium]